MDSLGIKTLENLGFINTKVLSFMATDSSKTFYFNSPFKNVVSAEVCMSLVPRGEYSIELHRNTFVAFKNITINGEPAVSTETLSLETRDYSVSEIISELNTRLSNFGISVAILTGKNKFEFSCNTAFSIDMIKSTTAEMFGFQDQIYESIEIDGSFKIFSPNKYNLIGTDVLYLHSNIDESFDTNSGSDSPLAVFYLHDNDNNQYWQTFRDNPNRYFHPIAKLDKLKLEFKDKNDNNYNFNGLFYNIQIILRYIDYGKNWATLDKEGSTQQITDMLENMINRAVSKTVDSIQINLPPPSSHQVVKEIETKKSFPIGKSLFGLSTFVGSGYLGYKFFKKRNVPTVV
tara:strand:- start:511 stop:1548 length:1038 start_codon:yes stop_codon:yes gene_type:complete